MYFIFCWRILNDTFDQVENVIVLETKDQEHTRTNWEKKLQWCISEYVNTGRRDSLQACRAGQREEYKSFKVSEKLPLKWMSICCKIIPSKQDCMCLNYMAGLFIVVYLWRCEGPSWWKVLHWRRGDFTGNKCDGKQVDHLNANEQSEQCSGQWAATEKNYISDSKLVRLLVVTAQ